MPGKVGVKIKAGRNLPVMDRSSDTTDAYVEIKLGNVTHKTDVCRKSLNPEWNTDWFRFEVDDAELQDEPLQIRLMDYDTYSANDAIGKVNISLNPLCLETAGQATHGKGPVFSGWIPVFDTMHGIRGEVNLIVKVDLFSDLNKFRQSSCGIPFFHSQCIPNGYRAQVIHGFVEELVVNDDPEYQWIDKIRTPRASNEARQVVFLKLSGQVQRKMGLKAINMGANAVIGYTQCFDLEGDVGVVARGIGTAVTLMKDTNVQSSTAAPDNALIEERTLKYLEFLTGSGGNLPERPPCQLQIRKSHSSTLFELKRASSELDDDAEIMLDLIRQEDERGEKPVKKLRHHMKRFTHSSRTMLNEKYNAFLRKIADSADSKSPESTSRSLSNLFSNTSGFIKEESVSSTRSSTIDLRRKPSFKAKHKVAAAKPLPPLHSLKNVAHPIVRSISDDSAMRYSVGGTRRAKAPNVDAIAEYQDSTRSSPNIGASRAAEEEKLQQNDFESKCRNNLLVSDASNTSDGTNVGGQQFGEFSKHVPHRLLKGVDTDTLLSCSSNTLSLSASDSSSSEEDTDSRIVVNDEERAKVEKFLKICNLSENENEKMDDKWIKPSELESVDDNLHELPQRSSLFRELKLFSQHVQDLIHKTKKSGVPTPNMNSPSHAPSIVNPLLPVPLGERKSYYSSQPEISASCDADMRSPPPTQLTYSRSLINLSKCASANIAPLAVEVPFAVAHEAQRDTNCTNALPNSAPQLDAVPLTVCQPRQHNCPVFKICPSTPTPSESDTSQMSPGELPFSSVVDAEELPVVVVDQVANPTPSTESVSIAARVVSNTSPPVDKCVNVVKSLLSPYSITPKNSTTVSKNQNSPKSRQSNAKTNTNHSNINSSLLAPSTSSLRCLTPTPSFSPPPSSPSSPQLCTKSPHLRHRHHHRSMNEISNVPAAAVFTGITDSPSMKRFTSPAAAAVAAAAAAVSNATAANPLAPMPAPNNALSRGKPSPINMNTAVAATGTAPTAVLNNAQAQAQAQPDSVSSSATTTTSIATTVIPKEAGEMGRRSSDSDLSVTPKGNSLCVASERLVAATAMMRLSQPGGGKNTNSDGIEMLEYPFLTMTKYPPGFILHLGATVAARSVKLLERVPNPDEPEVRDSWWTELRMEIRSHARALGCNVVLGYSEATTISDDVCVLSATGTAAVINMAYNRSISQSDIMTMTKAPSAVAGAASVVNSTNIAISASLEERDMLKEVRNGIVNEVVATAKIDLMASSVGATGQSGSGSSGKKCTLNAFNLAKSSTCTICHIPYNLTSVPFNAKMKKCAICRKGRVPDVLLATLEVPENLHVTGRGCFMQAQVVRPKKDLRSELNAKEISDGLPFLEYELHRVLINKLKAKGMNAIFGLKAQVAIGERMIALIATGTALFLTALPVPQVPKIVAGDSWTDKQKLYELQKQLQETFERNQEIYQLKCVDPDVVASSVGDKQSDTDESDDEVIEIDLNCGNKDACVLEVDDIEDLEIISLLMEPYPPEGFHVVNTQNVPGMLDIEGVKNLQMFTQVWRAKLDIGQNINGFPKHFQRLLQTIYFKLRTMIPCAICDLRFRLDLPESDQIQLLVTGMALGLGDSNKFKYRRKTYAGNMTSEATMTAQSNQAVEMNGTQNQKRILQEEDYIFPLDEDQMLVETPTPTSNMPPYGMHSFKMRKTSPSRLQPKMNMTSRNRFFPLRDRSVVDITPLSFIPGGRIDKYLGNLNFFFIRETTSIRENGGISGFVHSFITELLAVVRANIAALGGNAMVSFYMTELILMDNQHKNQGQCLISIGGDAVYVSYQTDD